MNPEDVKLSLIKNLKILFTVIKREKKFPLIIFCVFVLLYGGFLSLSTPSFMTNAFANFVMHVVLAVGYVVATVFIIAGAEHIWNDDDDGLKNIANSIINQFERDQLEAKKTELENIDSIIFGKDNK